MLGGTVLQRLAHAHCRAPDTCDAATKAAPTGWRARFVVLVCAGTP